MDHHPNPHDTISAFLAGWNSERIGTCNEGASTLIKELARVGYIIVPKGRK